MPRYGRISRIGAGIVEVANASRWWCRADHDATGSGLPAARSSREDLRHAVAAAEAQPVSAVVQGAGQAAEGATVSVAGLPNSALRGAGAKFVRDFTKADKRPPDPYSVYAAQAAEAMVAAIAASNGTRADINKKVFALNLRNSILGALRFNANGDVTSNPVTIYKIKGGKSTTLRVIVPPRALVKAA